MRAPGLRIAPPARVDGPIGAHDAQIVGLVIGADGRLMASADTDGTLLIYDLEAGRLVHRVAIGAEIVALAATASTIVVGSRSGLHIVHGFAGQVVAHCLRDRAMLAVAVSQDGAWAAGADQAGIALMRLATYRVKAQIPQVGVERLAVLEGELLALVDGAVRSWALRDQTPGVLAAFPDADTPGARVVQHPSGRATASFNEDGLVYLIGKDEPA